MIYRNSLTFFFRHPHPIYFSLEKLFHAVAGEIASLPDANLFVKEINVPFTSKLSTIRKNIAFVRKAQSKINHITGDIHYAILGCSKKNINVLTIHDCVLLYHYPRSSPRYWLVLWLWYRLPVKKADVITVISENTKKDLLHFTSCKPEKIRVIQNFLDPLFVPRPKPELSKSPKLLFIGTAPNKNLARTCQALAGMEIELLIVGYLDEAQQENLNNAQINYRILNKLSDAEMRELYATADIMIFPSVHEGFGLPIIEAQATGRPVLTSQLEPMASVAGGAACLVDPHDVESIRSGIKKIIGDASYRNDLVVKGYENVKRFQLKNTARQYYDLYQELNQQKS